MLQRKHYIALFKQEIILSQRGQTNIRKTFHKQLPKVYSYPFSNPIKHTEKYEKSENKKHPVNS